MKKKCKICGKEFVSHHLSHHIVRSHSMLPSVYYLKYINSQKGKCVVCGSPTNFRSLNVGFKNHCSIKCSNSDPEKIYKTEKVCLKKYGVKNIFQYQPIKNKIKKINIKNFGVDNPSKSGVIKEKKKSTVIKNFGKNYGSVLLKKRMKTCIKKYGMPHYNQTTAGIYKSIKHSYKNKPYKLPSGKIIYKQGYEPNLLNHIFSHNLLNEKDIVYHPNGISYLAIDNKIRYYFPDFYVPKINLIVECKSTWTLITDKNIEKKAKETIKRGFDYIRVVNNIFDKFDEKILNK